MNLRKLDQNGNYDLLSFFEKVSWHLSQSFKVVPQIVQDHKIQQCELKREQITNVYEDYLEQYASNYSEQQQPEQSGISESQKLSKQQKSNKQLPVRKSQRGKKSISYSQNQKINKSCIPKNKQKKESGQQKSKSSFLDNIKKGEATLVRSMKTRFEPDDQRIRRGLFFKMINPQDQICQQCKASSYVSSNKECQKCIQKGSYWIGRKELIKFNNGNSLRQYFQSFL